MKFRNKTADIEAVQLTWKNWGEVCDLLGGLISPENPGSNSEACSDPCGELAPFITLTLPTLIGDQVALHGDWIIKGLRGESFPAICKPDFFALTYEPVEEETHTLEDYLSSPSFVDIRKRLKESLIFDPNVDVSKEAKGAFCIPFRTGTEAEANEMFDALRKIVENL